MTTLNWSSTEATSFLWSLVDLDKVFKSCVLVMASLSATFLRFVVVAFSFVLSSLAATVEMISEGSRRANKS